MAANQTEDAVKLAVLVRRRAAVGAGELGLTQAAVGAGDETLQKGMCVGEEEMAEIKKTEEEEDKTL